MADPGSGGGRFSPGRTRELLQRIGHHPVRKLGQNFLVDGNIVDKSVRLAGDLTGVPVVEIGPGLGTLTGALLEAGAEVWAVERDERLAGLLKAEPGFAGNNRLHLRTGDALNHPLAGLPDDQQRADFRIVANLPYAITSPWVSRVLEQPVLPRHLVLLMQLEAADRLAGQPGGKQFGPLAIRTQAAYRIGERHKVAPGCFYPRPEVDSALLVLERRAKPHVFSPATVTLLRDIFLQRRKQLGSRLRKLDTGPAVLAWWEQHVATPLGPGCRPEAVPLTAWIALDEALRAGLA
ncbi:MAG: 16S rRNA (adenine(1518)-N(6)/adenine(1519)-N(6))-dimethyltransferase RsmA [Opitutales bacterium]